MQNTHFLRDYKALRIIFILIFTLFSLNSYSHSGASHEDEEVNIYSGRKGKLIEPMLKNSKVTQVSKLILLQLNLMH